MIRTRSISSPLLSRRRYFSPNTSSEFVQRPGLASPPLLVSTPGEDRPELPAKLCSRHVVVDNDGFWVRRRVHAMLVDHVASPVVFPGEALAPDPGIRARLLEAVELARLLVLVVDVPVEMSLGAEALVAVGVGTLVGTLVVSSMVAGPKVSGRGESTSNGAVLTSIYEPGQIHAGILRICEFVVMGQRHCKGRRCSVCRSRAQTWATGLSR